LSLTGLSLKFLLLVVLAALTLVFILFWLLRSRRQPSTGSRFPNFAHIAIGFVTNFFDTLGIGSFATTTAAYKLLRLVPDEIIPGTMIVGHSLAVITQAFIFIQVVTVDPLMLTLAIIAGTAGAWLGAGIVAGLPRRVIQLVMGAGLLMAAGSLLMSQLELLPSGGESLGLSTPRLIVALVGNFAFGALSTAGIGNYAPCFSLLSLLGLHPRAIFPVMMGSAAFMSIIAGIRFIVRGRFDQRAAIGLFVGGIPAVLIAAFLVKSLPLGVLRWMVIVVILYTAVTMLRSAHRERQQLEPRSTLGEEIS
jgi:uncharacterized membrane protein YfcA